MSVDDRLADLLLRLEELKEQGQCVTPEELCRDCPELLDELRRRLQALQSLDLALAAACSPSGGEASADAPTVPGSQSSPPPTLAVPGYEILGELGRGGMGVVYKARQISLDRLVALKVILAGAHAGTQQRQRFRGEAEAAARLQHPNIVQVYEIGEQDRCPYFSLEYVDGRNLHEMLFEDSPRPREAAALMEQVARAVYYAHQRSIVHRDLKPGNILLTPEGTPKITDFGLAKRLDKASAIRTRAGDVLGTPSYMAPEQAAGKIKEIGPGTDIYSLGAILYELLTGTPPFEGATAFDTVHLVLTAEPEPPSRRNPRVPRDLETICLKCLKKEPAKRYASALALADDLRRFQNGEPIKARPVGRLERSVKWARRRPAVAALVGVTAAFALAAGAAVTQMSHRHHPATAEDPLVALRRAEVRREVDSLRQRPPAVATGHPLRFEEVQTLPPVDYSALEILNDERIVDLRPWKPVPPERSAARVSAACMTRRLRLRKLKPVDEIRFEFRTTGIEIELDCPSHPGGYRVVAQKSAGFVGGKRTLVRQMIIDVRRVPVHAEFGVQTLAIYWNGLQKEDDLWFGAMGYEHSFKVSLLIVFPLEKPVKDFQLMVAPIKEEKPQAFQDRKILLVPEQRDWLYWEIPTPEAGHVYSLHWTW